MGPSFLLALALAQAPAPVVLDRIAAVVGDDILLESDVERYVAAEVLPRREGEGDEAYRERVLRERIVSLVRERELRKTAGLEPDPRDVAFRLEQLAARVEKESGLPFDAFLERRGVTKGEVTAWLRRGLALEAFTRERLGPVVKVTDAELESFYNGPFRVEAEASGMAELPPLVEVQDEVRFLLRERKLNAEIERWTNELEQKTRILVYRRPRPVAPAAPAAPAGVAVEAGVERR